MFVTDLINKSQNFAFLQVWIFKPETAPDNRIESPFINYVGLYTYTGTCLFFASCGGCAGIGIIWPLGIHCKFTGLQIHGMWRAENRQTNTIDFNRRDRVMWTSISFFMSLKVQRGSVIIFVCTVLTANIKCIIIFSLDVTSAMWENSIGRTFVLYQRATGYAFFFKPIMLYQVMSI